MALQSSGPISLEDIATELGVSTTNMSLRSLSNAAGFATPDAISEFYGYAGYTVTSPTTNSAYWDFQNSGEGLVFDRSSGTQYSTSADMSLSMWVRPDYPSTDVNWMLFHAGPASSTDTDDRFFFQYDYGLQRLIARFRSNAVNSRGLQWYIGGGANASTTGTTGGWRGNNVGNVNSAGLAHIVLTFDASATSGTNAFKCYWNGTELTTVTNNLTGSVTNFNIERICINKQNNNNNAAREGWYDNVALFHNKLLTPTEISHLYYSGVSLIPADHGLDADVAFMFDAENDPPTAATGSSHNTVWTLQTDNGLSISY